MKKVGKEAMTQAQRNRRYYDSKNLALFAVRVDRYFIDRLEAKLKLERMTKKDFLLNSIRHYLDEE